MVVGLAGCSSGDDSQPTADDEGSDGDIDDDSGSSSGGDGNDDPESTSDGNGTDDAGSTTEGSGGDATGSAGPTGGDEQIEWRMAHQNAANNTALNTWGPLAEPSVDWHFETGNRVRTAPIVAGDTVYAVAGDGYEGTVYAIDSATGEKRWEYETGGVQFSTPLLRDSVLYFGGRRFDEGAIPPVKFDGMVYALDAESGEEVWLLEDLAGDIVDTPPAMADGTLYVGSDDGNLYAVDPEAGEALWDIGLGGEIKGSPAIADGTLYVGTANNRGHGVFAVDLDAESGTWATEVSEYVHNAPVIADDTVYVADHLQNHAMTASEGEGQWTYQYDGISGAPPTESTGAVREDTVFLTSGGAIAAVDAADGSEQWGQGIRGAGSPIPGGPVVAGDVVYVADRDVVALDATGGEVLWTFEAEVVRTDPVVVNGSIYAGGPEGVYALSE